MFALKWISFGVIATVLSSPRPAAVDSTTAPQTRPDLVRVFPDEPGFMADVSADGRLAVVFTEPYGRGTDQRPSRIEIRNLLTHERVTLSGGVSNAGTPGQPAAAFSPDGKLVAYTWLDPKLTDTGMLQVIGVEAGAQPRTLIPADPSDIGIIPHAWSPDGTRILVLVHGASVTMGQDPTSLAWVSVADGRMRTIKTLEPWRDGGSALPRLSRDGRSIAYSAVARQGSLDRAIYVMDAESGAERLVAPMTGSSASPVWSPDGSQVVFVNRQPGSLTSDLCAVDVNRAARAVRLETAFPGYPVAITNNGTLYWMELDFGFTGVVVETGRPGARVLDEFSGYGVTWLRDDTVAFVREASYVVTRRLGSRSQRAYPHESLSVLGLRVALESGFAVLHIPASGDNGHPGGAFYQLDTSSGKFNRLFARDEPGKTRSSVSALSPDNRLLYLGVLTGTPSRWSSIVAVELASGRERRAIPLPEALPPVQGMAISPDGSSLALHAGDGRIFTVRTADGSVRELAGPSPGGGWSEVVCWSRDGRHVLFARRAAPMSPDWQLLRVPAAGGPAEPAGVSSSVVSKPGQLISLKMSPDDRQVALTVRRQPTFEVGALEGLVSRLRSTGAGPVREQPARSRKH
jgi:hypothetical protein